MRRREGRPLGVYSAVGSFHKYFSKVLIISVGVWMESGYGWLWDQGVTEFEIRILEFCVSDFWA